MFTLFSSTIFIMQSEYGLKSLRTLKSPQRNSFSFWGQNPSGWILADFCPQDRSSANSVDVNSWCHTSFQASRLHVFIFLDIIQWCVQSRMLYRPGVWSDSYRQHHVRCLSWVHLYSTDTYQYSPLEVVINVDIMKIPTDVVVYHDDCQLHVADLNYCYLASVSWWSLVR